MSAFGMIRIGVGAISLMLGAIPAVAWQQPSTDPDQPNVVMVQATDPAMEAAKATGRSTLPEFFKRLASPAADEDGFSVKFNLAPDREPEFIWARDLSVDGDGRLTGVLANHPLDDRFRLGQRVAIARAEIVDWSYYKGSVAQGHYTTRVILDRMPTDQAREVQASLGW